MLDSLIKWFKCQMCCSSKCAIGDELLEEEINYKSKRQTSIV